MSQIFFCQNLFPLWRSGSVLAPRAEISMSNPADDISFFPAYSHLHFPVYCVVSRPFLRKATRDSSDDIFSLYSHCVERKPLKIPSIHRLRPNFERNLCQNKEVCCVLTEKLRNLFVLLCFDEKFGLAHARKGARMF